MGRKRIRQEPVSEITRANLRTGEKLGIRYDGHNREIIEAFERKADLIQQGATEIGRSESKRLYFSDGKLLRAPQEVVEKRHIEEVTLTDISPSAAWKESKFRFRTARKMLPESFCYLISIKAWEKYVDFSLQRKLILVLNTENMCGVPFFLYFWNEGDCRC